MSARSDTVARALAGGGGRREEGRTSMKVPQMLIAQTKRRAACGCGSETAAERRVGEDIAHFCLLCGQLSVAGRVAAGIVVSPTCEQRLRPAVVAPWEQRRRASVGHAATASAAQCACCYARLGLGAVRCLEGAALRCNTELQNRTNETSVSLRRRRHAPAGTTSRFRAPFFCSRNG